MMSSVSQNGPAFFDRTSTASSPIVCCCMVLDLHHLDREKGCRRFGYENVVEMEFVDRSAIDLPRGEGQRHAGDQPVPLGDGIVNGEVADAGGDRVRQLLGIGNDVPQDADLM